MAKVVFGDGRQMSGSLGASTYMRDGRVRRRTNPANTVSTRKTAIQGMFGQLAAQWRTLSEATRAAWIGAVTRINALGAAITLSPIAGYVSVNSALMACGEAEVVLPPAFDGSTMLHVNSAVAVSGLLAEDQALTINLTNSSGGARKVIIEATRPISPGIMNFLTSLRQIGCFSKADGTADVDLRAAYVAVFGADALAVESTGKKIGFRVRDLNAGNPLLVGTLGVVIAGG